MNKFLKSNETKYRLARTILQGVIGVIIANLDLLVSWLTIPPEYKPMIVAFVMAVLSPIMSELGKNSEEPKEDFYMPEIQTDFNEEVEKMFEVEDYEDQDNTAEE